MFLGTLDMIKSVYTYAVCERVVSLCVCTDLLYLMTFTLLLCWFKKV